MQHHTSTKTETIVIKIGTSALSQKNGMPDREVLRAIVAEIAELKKAGHTVVLITSGAVGVGKAYAKQNKTKLSRLFLRDENKRREGENRKDWIKRIRIKIKQTAAGIGQPDLMKLYDELFLEHGIKRSQLLTEKEDFSGRRNGDGETTEPSVLDLSHVNPYLTDYLSSTLFFHEFIPIGNENDCTAIRELKLSDNDELSALIAVIAKADRVIKLTNTYGVHDSGHDLRPETVIPMIDFADDSTWPKDTDGTSTFGTGGMNKAMTYFRELTKRGIFCHVANSRAPNVIGNIMSGKNGGTDLVYGADMLYRLSSGPLRPLRVPAPRRDMLFTWTGNFFLVL